MHVIFHVQRLPLDAVNVHVETHRGNHHAFSESAKMTCIMLYCPRLKQADEPLDAECID